MKADKKGSKDPAVENKKAERAAKRVKREGEDYRRVLLWCAMVIVAGLVGQHLWLDWRHAGATFSLFLLGGLGIGVVASGIFAWAKDRKGTERFFVSIPFTVTVLGALTVATIAGTMVLQKVYPERFDSIYSPGVAQVLRFLFLDDLFHSFWFVGLVTLAAMSLTVMALKSWPWTLKKSGRVAAHLGIVTGLLGALIGQVGGEKGRADLVIGKASDRVLGFDWRTGRRIPATLPFELRLDDFHVDTHDVAFRVYVFQRTGDGDHSEAFKALLTIDPTKRSGEVVPLGGGYALRVDDHKLAAAPSKKGAGTHSLALTKGSKPVKVDPNSVYEDIGGLHVTTGAFFPHFNYDIDSKKAVNGSDEPRNPAIDVTIRAGGPTGEIKYKGWLFANMPGFSMDHQGAKDGEEPAEKPWVPLYVFGGAGASEGPSVRVTVLKNGVEDGQTRLSLRQGNDFVNLAERQFVAVFRVRDDEAKNYFSTLSVLEEGRVIRSQQIFVNAPMYYKGYAFYQSNYDPKNLRYSGIEVVKDPGIGFVYFGLTAMMLGVFQLLYFRAFGRKTSKPKVTDAGTGEEVNA